MTQNTNLNIVYTCNDKLFNGLYLSILSMLRRTKSSINFYIFSGNFTSINEKYTSVSKQHIDILNELVKRFNNNNSVSLVDCTNWYNETIALCKNLNVLRNSPYALLRLFIDRVDFNSKYVLYLDTDVMINGDINNFFQFDLDDYQIGVCHDYLTPTRSNKDYFNSGAILFNIPNCKKTNFLKKTLDYLITNNPKLIDQDALNATAEKVFFFPDEYRYNYQMAGIKDDTIVKHFINIPRKKLWTMSIRQWHWWRVKHFLHLHNWDEDYKIFFAERKKWKNS